MAKNYFSDRGAEFVNRVLEEIVKITKITHITTKGYNQRKNGLTERLNGTIVAMLRRSTIIPTEWDTRLPFCMMSYNVLPHISTGESPYFLLHGMDPTFSSEIIPNAEISWYSMDRSLDEYKTETLQSVAEAHERVGESNERVRERMEKLYDERNKVDSKTFPKVGGRVYVLSPNEKARNAHPKLTFEWAGPFRVLEVS